MASLGDILTAAKNIVTAINGAAQTYLSVNGLLTAEGITSTTLVQAGQGRVATVSIVVGGSVNGTIYDCSTIALLKNPIYTIPDTIGIVFVNLPVSLGIVVVPGSGQTISISYS